MDNNRIEQISETMRGKSNEELKIILSDNDSTHWSEEAFEAIRQVLSQREHHRASLQDLENAHDINGLLLIVADKTGAYSDHDRREAAMEPIPPIDACAQAALHGNGAELKGVVCRLCEGEARHKQRDNGTQYGSQLHRSSTDFQLINSVVGSRRPPFAEGASYRCAPGS